MSMANSVVAIGGDDIPDDTPDVDYQFGFVELDNEGNTVSDFIVGIDMKLDLSSLKKLIIAGSDLSWKNESRGLLGFTVERKLESGTAFLGKEGILKLRLTGAATGSGPRITQYYVSTDGKPQTFKDLLRPILERLSIDGDLLNLEATFVAQCAETDMAFLTRVASWHGLVINRNLNGELSLLDPSQISSAITLDTELIDTFRVDWRYPVSDEVVVAQQDIGTAYKPDASSDKLKDTLIPASTGEITDILPAGIHLPESTKHIAQSALRCTRSAALVVEATLILPEAIDVMNHTHIDIPDIGTLAIWYQELIEIDDAVWRLRIEAREPGALPVAIPAPTVSYMVGQVCGLEDPVHLGRIKVNLPGMDKSGSAASWEGAWCHWLGAGGVDESSKVHGTWVPPRVLDSVAVLIDPQRSNDPLVLGSVVHKGCTARELGTTPNGPQVLFKEGELRIQADPENGTLVFLAGDQKLSLSSKPELGISVVTSKLEIKANKEATIESSNSTFKGNVNVKGKLNVQ